MNQPSSTGDSALTTTRHKERNPELWISFFFGILVGHVPPLRGCGPGKRHPAGEARPDVPGDRRSAIFGVYEQAHRSITPILNAEGGAVDARADDDLVALGPHPLDGAQGGDLAGSLAPALLRRPVAGAGADLTVGLRLEPLDMVALVIKARAEQMCEESVRAATKHCGHLHCSVSRGSVVANGGVAPPQGSIRRPPPCQARTLRGVRWSQGDRQRAAVATSGCPGFGCRKGWAPRLAVATSESKPSKNQAVSDHFAPISFVVIQAHLSSPHRRRGFRLAERVE